MKSFDKILIANRGEIALRIMRACRQMGIGTVAVYSEADRQAPHARLADEAVPLGPAPSQQSYLHIERILEAARRTGAEAIHPGYGFLAENADFAAACESSGIIFIGPPSRVIRQMGRKSAARTLAERAGVATVPGYHGEDQSPAALGRAAHELGFPILIKASAGGGGRGMRLVSDPADFLNAAEAARREAETAFGDGELLIESYIRGARHVEFQIMGDAGGHLVHLFERDCSIQRRHQKIIEESPSPALPQGLRAEMAQAALALGRAIGYRNAGTVEFLLAPSSQFFFLEMNTRIQVEHPLTEMVTGLDLIRLQVELAEGRPLPFQQDAVRPSGHAIEARLYAEDPSRGFLPATGTLHVWKAPQDIEGLRIDAGVEQGTEIGIYYDPLLAKLVGYGADREAARRKLIYGLRNLAVLGVSTNQEFLLHVLESEDFREAKVHTGFLEEHPFAGGDSAALDFLFAAALALYLEQSLPDRREILPGVPPHYRNNPYREPSLDVRVGAADFTVRWKRREANLYRVGGKQSRNAARPEAWPAAEAGAEAGAEAEVVSLRGGSMEVVLDGIRRTFHFQESGDEFFVRSSLGCRAIRRLPRYPLARGGDERLTAHSPMPGQVLRILVREGQQVKAGDSLLVLEAMKMEQTIQASADGVVGAVLVEPGEIVAPGQSLVEVRPAQRTDESQSTH